MVICYWLLVFDLAEMVSGVSMEGQKSDRSGQWAKRRGQRAESIEQNKLIAYGS